MANISSEQIAANYQQLNLKSTSKGFWLAVLLGPLGLMYSRPVLGLVMLLIVALSWATVILPVVMWICAVLMAPWGVIKHNQKIRLNAQIVKQVI